MEQHNNQEEILSAAIPLFSASGYAGVSMRDIARACHLNVGSLYHHFRDKQHLHLAAIQHAFTDRSAPLLEILEGQEPPLERLTLMIDLFCHLLSKDQTFSRLIQRELLDADEVRLKFLADHVFGKFSNTLNGLCRELNPQFDPVLLANSIIGMVIYLFQSAPLRRNLFGFREEHEQPEIISQHLQQLLCQGLNQPVSIRGIA
jgi:AcrR family transcriptional regulator